MTRPDALLPALQRADATRPRITCYDDTDSPSRGERIELSARVLSNWVAKAANALQEEFDVEPGSVVLLALPPHWRVAYWALGVWAVGGCVSLDRDVPADVCVSDDAALIEAFVGRAGAGAGAVLVTLPALARGAGATVASGVLDEAAQLATYPDQFEPWAEADDDDPALIIDGQTLSYGALTAWAGSLEQDARAHLSTDDSTRFLTTLLRAWGGGGSLVLTRGEPAPQTLAERLATERVTHAL